MDILRAEFLQHEQENILFSPLSVGMSLGMIYNGVGEKEKLQIQEIMGLESLMEKEINKSYNELLSFLQASNDQLKISYANSLWFSNDIAINEDFRTRVMAYYDAEIGDLNFRKPSSLDYINNWGSLKSRGSFQHLIQTIPANNTDILLINAFALNSSWKLKNNYFQYQSDFFTTSDKKQTIDMLGWNGMNIKLNENDDYAFLEIPFEHDQFYLAVVQPDLSSSFSEFISEFTIDELRNLIDNSLEYKANVSLPHINFSSEQTLKSTLSSIGLDQLFLTTTDLSPSFPDEYKKISEINHLARINIKEDLTLNQSEHTFTEPNLKMVNVNHPFLYFVRDKHTKTVLFAGYYAHPKE